jgi:hypothetical protein
MLVLLLLGQLAQLEVVLAGARHALGGAQHALAEPVACSPLAPITPLAAPASASLIAPQRFVGL